MRHGLGSFITALTIGLLCGCGKTDKPADAGQQPITAAQTSSVVSKENYLKIQTGMRADDLELLLGKPTSKNEFYKDSVETQDWHWKDGKRKFYVILKVKDGGWVVKDKTQFNLD